MTNAGEVSVLLRGMRRLWWLITVFVLVGGAVGYYVSADMAKVYQATTTILVGETLRKTNVELDDIKASESVAMTYRDIVRRQPVLEGVIRALRLPTTWPELRERVRVNLASDNAQLIAVTVEARSPDEAKAIADEIGRKLIALSPNSSNTKDQEFVLSQLVALQQRIEDGQRRVGDLRSELTRETSSSETNALSLQIDELERMISAWQENYASLSALMPRRGGATSLEILEEAYASSDPVQPKPRNTALVSAASAGMLALAFVYVAEMRRRVARPKAKPPNKRRWLPRRRGQPGEFLPDQADKTTQQVEVAAPQYVS
jgi:capsular polysaccharide biosynthesis protein